MWKTKMKEQARRTKTGRRRIRRRRIVAAPRTDGQCTRPGMLGIAIVSID